MPPDEPAWMGKDAIRSGFKKGFEQYDLMVENSVEDVQTFEGRAFMRGVYTVKLTPKTGGESIQETGKWMAFRQRQQDGSWKTVSDIYNSDNPPPGVTN